MSVRVIERIDGPKKDGRRAALVKDGMEIIRGRIWLCEIEDPPFPDSSMRSNLQKALCMAIREVWPGNQYHMPTVTGCFRIEERKQQDRKHWYVRFDVAAWDKKLEEIGIK